MYFFTSDTHFNDEPTLLMDNRPFETAEQFDNYVLQLWNSQAQAGDTIFVIGDFVDCDGSECDGWKKSINYVKELNILKNVLTDFKELETQFEDVEILLEMGSGEDAYELISTRLDAYIYQFKAGAGSYKIVLKGKIDSSVMYEQDFSPK